MTITEGDNFQDPGATATDDEDGNVNVNVSGNVDSNTPGTYTLTYTATDSSNNTSTKTRTVIVEEVSINYCEYNFSDDSGYTIRHPDSDLEYSQMTSTSVVDIAKSFNDARALDSTINGKKMIMPTQTK
jgi:hypothetical protein